MSSPQRSIPDEIGRYRLLRRLGQGGMGEVFLAQDTSLDRQVALKVLPEATRADPIARERFVSEAKSAAAIDHPYVCKVYEAGEFAGHAFIAMEFVEGETLAQHLKSGPLPWREAWRIAMEMTEALVRAHEKGVVHRDLKPSNVMLLPQGHVKLLDFGLAKRTLSLDDATISCFNLTHTGAIVGTMSYMSPEQVRGLPVDHRSDIFSLGLVVCEMVTGVNPFARGTPMDTAAAILTQELPRSALSARGCPRRLEEILAKMLAKPLAERYPSMNAVCGELHRVESEAGAEPPVARQPALSIAVLPFINMSADPDQEYFSDGLTEDIIARLSSIPGLRVISRGSVMCYRNTQKDLAEIARELRVANVLEGSVRRAGKRVRITSGLVEVESRQQLWSERYDREMNDIFAIQDEVSHEIAAALSAAFSPSRKTVPRPGSRELEAYHLYLKGRYFLNKLTPEGTAKAVHYFQEALDLEPTDARSYAGISTAYAMSANFDFLPPDEAFPKARAAARRALDLDGTLAEAQTSMALVQLFHDWDWQAADAAFLRAIELNPNWAEAHTYYSWCLCMRRRFEPALIEARRALDLDPLSPFVSMNLGWVLSMAGRLDEAVRQFERTLEIDPNYLVVNTCLAWVHWARRDYDGALRCLSGWTWRKSFVAQTYALAGRRDEALAVLNGMLDAREIQRPSEIALIYLYLGERERAAEWLERAFSQRDYMIALQLCPDWAGVRTDPLVAGYLRRMGLEP